jgi:L-amino acid N-acyltransferase
LAERSTVTIRTAEPGDLEAITEIYNEAVLTTTATFDVDPKTVAERQDWFRQHDARHPILVALYGERIAGWTSLSRFSERSAYDETAETSFYVGSAYRGRGIGRALKAAIIAEARRLGFHTLLARVAEGSEASRHLNKSFGFVDVGTLKAVGQKFGRRLDVHLMQLMLTD